MARASFVRIGRVARAHGLRGEVSVVMTEDVPPDDLVGLRLWFVPPGQGLRDAVVSSVRQGPKGPLFSFEGLDAASGVADIRGLDVAIAAADLPEGYEDLTFDPVGLAVLDEEGERLGQVADVLATGANDVWVVERDGKPDLLLPVIEDVVLDVDEDAGSVTVRLLPGLCEE